MKCQQKGKNECTVIVMVKEVMKKGGNRKNERRGNKRGGITRKRK